MIKKTTDKSLTYAQSGVDIDAGNALVERIKPAVRSTVRPGADGALGGFGGLFDLKAAGFNDPILIAANDGVGTKVKIAIETGYHDTIGIDLVAMCVNDLIVQGGEPLFFLDYFATGKLDVEQGAAIIEGIANGCRQANCALIGGETAEMPGMYAGDDYDLAGFCVGAGERDQLLPRQDIQSGDVILGLPSAGLHSNGFSLARRVVEMSGLSWQEDAPFDNSQTLGQALLCPTRIYVREVLKTIRDTNAPKALAHITGGGLIENIPRVLPDNLAAHIELSSWTPPAIFSWLAQTGGIETKEMIRTFNCGIGMIIVVSGDDCDLALKSLHDQGEAAIKIGEIIERDGDGVKFSGTLAL